MFQQLRPNSQIYILHRGGESLSIETGFVTNVSIPRFKFSNTQVPIGGQQLPNQSMVVDIAANVGGQAINYTQIDAGADIAESFGSNGESIVITTSKEAMNSEILSLKQRSQDVINSKPYHEKLITEYDKIYLELNPDYAEKEQQKSEMKSMKEQMNEMAKTMTVLLDKLNKKEI